jgi:nucleoid-associated protein YgaU
VPIYRYSRYWANKVYTDTGGTQYLDEREPVRYRDAPDNIYHTVRDGDTLWGLAHRYFQGLPNACRRWWILAEYQPTPILDPTIALQPGTVVVVPSLRFVHTVVYGEDRRRYH